MDIIPQGCPQQQLVLLDSSNLREHTIDELDGNYVSPYFVLVSKGVYTYDTDATSLSSQL